MRNMHLSNDIILHTENSAKQQLPIMETVGEVIRTIGVPVWQPPAGHFHLLNNRIFSFSLKNQTSHFFCFWATNGNNSFYSSAFLVRVRKL